MAITFNDYMPIIWNRLIAAGCTKEGAAGLMGNLYAESGCTPYACQPSRPYSVCMTYIANVNSGTIDEYSFVHRGCSSTGGIASGQGGFGLAQWTYYTRKQALYAFWGHTGSIGDLGIQITYMISELQSDYAAVWTTLTTANDLSTASNKVLFDYENPLDKSAAVQSLRLSYATEIYNAYSGTAPIDPPDPQPSPVDPPEPEPSPPIIPASEYENHLPIWAYPYRRV